MEQTQYEKAELCTEIGELIEYVERTHRYSMSRIYSAYNKVFSKDEKPQSCASCLIRKVRELKVWMDNQAEREKPKSSKRGRKKKTPRNEIQ